MRHRFLPMAFIGAISALFLLLAFLPGVALAQADTQPVNVSVVQSDGATPINGVWITYQCNGGGLMTFGWTDADGHAGPVQLPVGASCNFTASYQGTTSATKALTVVDGNDTVTFQTSAVTVTLTDHNGHGLAGGDVYYRSGAYTYWLVGNHYQTSYTDANGQVTGEMFPGTYDFTMQYNTGAQTKISVTVSNGSTVPFQTGQLILVYSQPISFGAGSPTVAWFTNAGTELLPGTYLFRPQGSGCTSVSIDAPVPGTSATKSIIAARLLDHSGAPLAGGTAYYYASNNTWQSLGTTDANGSACGVIDGKVGSTYVDMVYQGMLQKMGLQTVATNSIFTFQTSLVTVKLEDHAGNPLDSGTAAYYDISDQWVTIGTTTGSGQVQLEMLPGSYSFDMFYGGVYQKLTGQVVTLPTTTITYKTGEVVSNSVTATAYYAGGWHAFSQGMELLPGSYTFAFSDGTPDTAYTVVAGTVNQIH